MTHNPGASVSILESCSRLVVVDVSVGVVIDVSVVVIDVGVVVIDIFGCYWSFSRVLAGVVVIDVGVAVYVIDVAITS